MKPIVFFLVVISFASAYSQKPITRQVNINPSTRAATARDTLTRWLSLSSTQSATVYQVYNDYYAALDKLRADTTISTTKKMMVSNQIKAAVEGKLKSTLTPNQLSQFKEHITQVQERRAKVMDSLRAAHDVMSNSRLNKLDSIMKAHADMLKNIQRADSIKTAPQKSSAKKP